ncbi:hypothetical protein VI08_04785 [Luteibacter yeojuensis]|uniref:Lysozyme inhibitor LprI-like N-terminal domain-containing protein n=2 Tax=Luteibacter yeojuensis TaxID=345309 RepID=A0A0F3KZ26_9GAMM|nr:hypothetical protein VI08_04785 [Luteibacter yeojuensis]
MACAIVLATACVGGAVAAEPGLRPAYQQCIDATGGVTPDIKKCMSAEYAFQDRRLNNTYRTLMASLHGDAVVALRAEERAWIKEKEAKCDAGREPGQADELAAYDCSVTQTAKRAAELEKRLAK